MKGVQHKQEESIMKKNRLLMTAGILAVSLLASGCGGSKTDATTAAATVAETKAETTAAVTEAATEAETAAPETTVAETETEPAVEIPDNWDWQSTENPRKGLKADFCLQKLNWEVTDASSSDPVTSNSRTNYKVKTENGVTLKVDMYLYVREDKTAEEDITPKEGKKIEITDYDQKGIYEESSTADTYTLVFGPYEDGVTMMAKAKISVGKESDKSSEDYAETVKAVLSTLKVTDMDTMHTTDKDFFYTDSAKLKVPKTVEFDGETAETTQSMRSGFTHETCAFVKDGLRYWVYIDTPDNNARWEGLTKDHTDTTFCGNPARVKFYTEYDGTEQQMHFQYDGVNYYIRIGVTAIKDTDEYYKNVENISLGNLGTVLNGTEAYNTLREAIKDENSEYQKEAYSFAEAFWNACLEKTGVSAGEQTASAETDTDANAAEAESAAEGNAENAAKAEATEDDGLEANNFTEADAELTEEVMGDWYMQISAPDGSGKPYGLHLLLSIDGTAYMFCYDEEKADGQYYYEYVGKMAASADEANAYKLTLHKQSGEGPDDMDGIYYLISEAEDYLLYTRKSGTAFCEEVRDNSVEMVRSMG